MQKSEICQLARRGKDEFCQLEGREKNYVKWRDTLETRVPRLEDFSRIQDDGMKTLLIIATQISTPLRIIFPFVELNPFQSAQTIAELGL